MIQWIYITIVLSDPCAAYLSTADVDVVEAAENKLRFPSIEGLTRYHLCILTTAEQVPSAAGLLEEQPVARKQQCVPLPGQEHHADLLVSPLPLCRAKAPTP